MQKDQIPVEIDDLNLKSYWHFAIKKGYSGTAILSKDEPISVSYGIGSSAHDDEGRTVTLEYKDFYLVNAYVPNAQPELKRIDFRTSYEKKLLSHIKKLDKKGVYLMLSNNDVELVYELYHDYNIDVIDVKRNINSKADKRTGREVIITNYERF